MKQHRTFCKSKTSLGIQSDVSAERFCCIYLLLLLLSTDEFRFYRANNLNSRILTRSHLVVVFAKLVA